MTTTQPASSTTTTESAQTTTQAPTTGVETPTVPGADDVTSPSGGSSSTGSGNIVGSPSIPNTGAESNTSMAVLLVLCMAAAASMTFVLVTRKKSSAK